MIKKLLFLFLSGIVLQPAVMAQDSGTLKTLQVKNIRLRSSNPTPPSEATLGIVHIASEPCLEALDFESNWKEANENINRLGLRSSANSALGTLPHPSFIWPVRPKAGFSDYGYYTVQYLVDHNSAYNNQLQDYHCGTRTYDGSSFNHAGTDIILWPYPWRRMDEQVMEVVAAAPGVIVSRADNNFDRRCVNNGTGLPNKVQVRHADGSIAWYWHLKTGSLTPKLPGDSVVTGEYLGTAGSSGSSSWPHLHFQVLDSLGNLIDPWDGSCNMMNPGDSWWQNQQTYTVPTVNRICTKKTISHYYNCPTPEPDDDRDTFYLGDTLAIWLYYRDLELNSTTTINLKNPAGQTAITFDFISPWATSPTSYAAWYYNVDAWWTPGQWTFEAIYNGQTYQHTFFMTGGYAGTDENERWKNLVIYPNPAVNEVTLSGISFEPGMKIQLTDAVGRLINEKIISEPDTKVLLQTNGLDAGLYLVKLEHDGNETVRRLFISG